MDIRNSRGQRVSILSEPNEIPTLRPSHGGSLTSYYSSASTSSTPTLPSPKTPSISRSGSSDSQNSSLRSPSSPHSPNYALHTLHPSLSLPTPKFATGASRIQPLIVPSSEYYYLRQYSTASMDQFGQTPQQNMVDLQPSQQFPVPGGVLPGPPFDLQGLPQMTSFDQQHQFQQPQQPQAPVTKKKNSYPCPVAKQYGCSEFFTTSGHAARHAKKHTGKKDAICPECKKAFTRKDNMEQHRRTHSSVRGQAKAAAAAAGSEEKQAKKAKQAQKKANRDANLDATAAAAAANAAMPQLQMPAMMQGIPLGMQQALPQGMQPGHMLPAGSQMQMDPALSALLDPRLMDGSQMPFTAEFAAQLAQQQFNVPVAYAQPGPHRSSYDETLPNNHTPDSVLGDGQALQNGAAIPGASSPTVQAPALDALAMAAASSRP